MALLIVVTVCAGAGAAGAQGQQPAAPAGPNTQPLDMFNPQVHLCPLISCYPAMLLNGCTRRHATTWLAKVCKLS